MSLTRGSWGEEEVVSNSLKFSVGMCHPVLKRLKPLSHTHFLTWRFAFFFVLRWTAWWKKTSVHLFSLKSILISRFQSHFQTKTTLKNDNLWDFTFPRGDWGVFPPPPLPRVVVRNPEGVKVRWTHWHFRLTISSLAEWHPYSWFH